MPTIKPSSRNFCPIEMAVSVVVTPSMFCMNHAAASCPENAFL
jgi:hypothetical protein